MIIDNIKAFKNVMNILLFKIYIFSEFTMFLNRSEYDRGPNTFSPEGRLFQVDQIYNKIYSPGGGALIFFSQNTLKNRYWSRNIHSIVKPVWPGISADFLCAKNISVFFFLNDILVLYR